MKPRLPTAEERRLWRESNRLTQKIIAEHEEAHADAQPDATMADAFGPAAGSPSPHRGEVRRGAPRPVSSESGKDGASTAPSPTLPRGGRELATAPASSLQKTTAKTLTSLPMREAAKRFKSHTAIEATLDLHGLGKLEAYAAVKRFLTRQQQAGRRHVLIITGKGRAGEGILQRELPHWLNEPALRPVLSAFAHARPEKGGSGAMHVLLKKAPV